MLACVSAEVYVEVWGCQESSSITLPMYSLWGSSHNPTELRDKASWLVLGTSCLCLPRHTHLAFTWVLRVQNLVLPLCGKCLTTEPSPSSQVYFLYYNFRDRAKLIKERESIYCGSAGSSKRHSQWGIVVTSTLALQRWRQEKQELNAILGSIGNLRKAGRSVIQLLGRLRGFKFSVCLVHSEFRAILNLQVKD